MRFTDKGFQTRNWSDETSISCMLGKILRLRLICIHFARTGPTRPLSAANASASCEIGRCTSSEFRLDHITACPRPNMKVPWSALSSSDQRGPAAGGRLRETSTYEACVEAKW